MTTALSAPFFDAATALPRTDVPEEVFSAGLAAHRAGHTLALVTLVGVTGRSARALGSQMIVLDDGRHCGFVAGGCTEAAIATEAAEAIARGKDRILRLGEGSPFFDIVLPCGGGIELSIQIVHDPQILFDANAAFAARRVFTLGMESGRARIHFQSGEAPPKRWHDGIFQCRYRPRPRLVVCGRGVEATALARLAARSDLDLVCATPDERTIAALTGEAIAIQALTTPASFDAAPIDAHSAVALLFHDHDWELPILEAALARNPFYIGALGSRRTHERRCEALARQGVPEDAIARIKGPIGAFGPARDSGALAASILADVYARRSVDS